MSLPISGSAGTPTSAAGPFFTPQPFRSVMPLRFRASRLSKVAAAVANLRTAVRQPPSVLPNSALLFVYARYGGAAGATSMVVGAPVPRAPRAPADGAKRQTAAYNYAKHLLRRDTTKRHPPRALSNFTKVKRPGAYPCKVPSPLRQVTTPEDGGGHLG